MESELDKILDYIQVQMKKPVPSDIREEVVGVGDLIVKEEAKSAIIKLLDRETKKAIIVEIEKALDAGNGTTWDSQMAGTVGYLAKRYKELTKKGKDE